MEQHVKAKSYRCGIKIALLMHDKNAGGINMAGINILIAIAESDR